MAQNFLELPFKDEEFDFIFDMGCFHHVKELDRNTFIKGVHRVLKKTGIYFLICFSYKNGQAWNHFTKGQLIRLFSDYFIINEIRYISSIEGDGFRRYFYWVLMEKK
jgi:ubiquinone/menaquinone biosynthesis C-methylase UbiE